MADGTTEMAFFPDESGMPGEMLSGRVSRTDTTYDFTQDDGGVVTLTARDGTLTGEPVGTGGGSLFLEIENGVMQLGVGLAGAAGTYFFVDTENAVWIATVDQNGTLEARNGACLVTGTLDADNADETLSAYAVSMQLSVCAAAVLGDGTRLVDTPVSGVAYLERLENPNDVLVVMAGGDGVMFTMDWFREP